MSIDFLAVAGSTATIRGGVFMSSWRTISGRRSFVVGAGTSDHVPLVFRKYIFGTVLPVRLAFLPSSQTTVFVSEFQPTTRKSLSLILRNSRPGTLISTKNAFDFLRARSFESSTFKGR